MLGPLLTWRLHKVFSTAQHQEQLETTQTARHKQTLE